MENLKNRSSWNNLTNLLNLELKNKVCVLHKSLYGLKQFLRLWYKTFDDFVPFIGFSRYSYDHCVYFMKFENENFVYLLIYVNCMLLAFKDVIALNNLKHMLKTKSKMKDLGTTKEIFWDGY